MLKELCCTAMLLTAGANLYAQEPQSIEKSQTIVYINGAKYYVHNVRHGETLYSLAKTYGVAEQVIAAENPQLAQGLKADQSLKIPVVETGVVVQEQLSPKKLKKTFDQHTVQKGETLYGISKRYAISVETIMEDNPGLDPIHLKPGSVILIRKKAVGKTEVALCIGRRHTTLVHPVKIKARPRRVCRKLTFPHLKQYRRGRSSGKGNGKRTFGLFLHCLQYMSNEGL